MIELRNINKVYKNKKFKKYKALHNVNCVFKSNSLNLLIGKSGSGKSTLLNIISTVDKPTTGNIYVDGQKLQKKFYDAYRNSYISYISQDFSALSKRNLKENLEIIFDLAKKKFNLDEVREALNKVNLLDDEVTLDVLLKKLPNELSVGQLQRFTLARALIKGTKVILLDEPTSALDEENSKQLLEILKDLSKDKTIIVSSHDTELFTELADQIIEIKNHESKVIKEDNREKCDETKCSLKKLRKGRLSFLNLFKVSFKNLCNKQIRFITSLVLAISVVSILGIAFSCMTIDVNSVLIRTQHDNKRNDNFIWTDYLVDEHNNLSDRGHSGPITETQITKIKEYTKGNCAFGNRITHYINDTLMRQPNSIIVDFLSNPFASYIEMSPDNYFEISGLKRFPKLKEETVNKYPSKVDEVAISNVEAEVLYQCGLIEKNMQFQETNRKQFKTYDEIIGSTLYGFKIVGIFESDEEDAHFYDKFLESKAEVDDYTRRKVRCSCLTNSLFYYEGASKYIYDNLENKYKDYTGHNVAYVKFGNDVNRNINFFNSLSEGKRTVAINNSYYGLSEIVYSLNIFTYPQYKILLALVILINVFITIGLFSSLVTYSHRTLGVLKAYGASNGSVVGIIIIQALLASLTELLCALIIVPIVNSIINVYAMISILHLTALAFGYIVALIFGTAAFTTLFSSRKALMYVPIKIVKK